MKIKKLSVFLRFVLLVIVSVSVISCSSEGSAASSINRAVRSDDTTKSAVIPETIPVSDIKPLKVFYGYSKDDTARTNASLAFCYKAGLDLREIFATEFSSNTMTRRFNLAGHYWNVQLHLVSAKRIFGMRVDKPVKVGTDYFGY